MRRASFKTRNTYFHSTTTFDTTDTSLFNTYCRDSGISSNSSVMLASNADPSDVVLPPNYMCCVQALYSGSNRKEQSHCTTSLNEG